MKLRSTRYPNKIIAEILPVQLYIDKERNRLFAITNGEKIFEIKPYTSSPEGYAHTRFEIDQITFEVTIE